MILRLCRAIVGATGILGLAGCSLVSDLNDSTLHPSRTFELVPGDLGLAPETIAIPVDGAVICAWSFRAPGSDCTLVVCGGNSSNMQLCLPIAQVAAAAGYNVVLYDHRGFGLSTGKPDVFSLVPDTVAVLRAVHARPGARRMAVFGISLGSVAAVGATHACPELVDAVVVEALFSPHVQLKKQYGGFLAFLGEAILFPAAWDVEAHVPRLPQPLLMLHGDNDFILHCEDSEAIYAACAGNDPPRFLWIARGAGHAPGIAARFGPDYAGLVTSFLDSFLKGAPRPWFRANWHDGRVALAPIGFFGTEAVPVEIAAIAEDGKPSVIARWFDPANPALFEFPLPAKPVFVSAVAPTGPVRRDGDGWVRTSKYVESYAAWRAFEDAFAGKLESHLFALQIDHALDETHVKALEAGWKKQGKTGDARAWLKEHGLLLSEGPLESKVREDIARKSVEAEQELARLLGGGVDPEVRPRYAEDARRIADAYDALDEKEGATRVRRLYPALLAANPDAWVEFNDASWHFGPRSSDALDRLAASDPSFAEAAAAWHARGKTRKAFLEEWLKRNQLPGTGGSDK